MARKKERKPKGALIYHFFRRKRKKADLSCTKFYITLFFFSMLLRYKGLLAFSSPQEKKSVIISVFFLHFSSVFYVHTQMFILEEIIAELGFFPFFHIFSFFFHFAQVCIQKAECEIFFTSLKKGEVIFFFLFFLLHVFKFP